VTRWPAALLILTCACTRSASDHEELGDRAYAAADYRSALAEYQLGLKAHSGSASLDAKLGAAALHTQDYFAAAEAYRALARDDRSRADEAADALERVVRAALGTNDRGALASALTGMREVAPSRPLGRYATLAALYAVDRGDTATALSLLPVATAASTDPARADSLLYLYGMALVRVRDCTTAVSVFEGVIWRKRAPVVVESAREGLGLCALVEGQIALEQARREAEHRLQSQLSSTKRLGNTILETKSLSKNYDGRTLVKDLDFIMVKGDRVALLGRAWQAIRPVALDARHRLPSLATECTG